MDNYIITLPSGRTTIMQLTAGDAKRYPTAKKVADKAAKK